MLYDATRCIGCRYCEQVCAESHNLPVPKDKLKTGVLAQDTVKPRGP